MKKRKLKGRIAVLASNRGDIGVKQIAVTVAIIVILGLFVSILSGGFLSTMVDDTWTMMKGYIENTFK